MPMSEEDEVLRELALRRARAFETLRAMGVQGVPFGDLAALAQQDAAYRLLADAAYAADGAYRRAAAAAAQRRTEQSGAGTEPFEQFQAVLPNPWDK